MVRSERLVTGGGTDSLETSDNSAMLNFQEVKTTESEGQGQLSSSGTTNSCSSWKTANNRNTEMAQEDNSPCWNNLPSVILLEIFSYLPHDEKIRTSQVSLNY